MKFNPFHFWTKDYEIDLLAPFREIVNDIKRMRKIKQNKNKVNIGVKQCATCEKNIKCNECAYPFNNKELIKEIDRLRAENASLQKFKSYFDELYGKGLDIANWHRNGDLEPFDNFFESAVEEMEGE